MCNCQSYSEHLNNLKELSGEKPKEKCSYCGNPSDELILFRSWSKVLKNWFEELICPKCVEVNEMWYGK